MIILTKINKTLFTQNKELRLYTVKWFLYWLITMSLYSLAMRFFPRPDVVLTIITCIYFFVMISFAVRFFKSTNQESLRTVVLITSSLLLFSLAIPFLDNISPLSLPNIDYFINKGFYYPLLYFQTSLIKACDICFQQIMIYSFIQEYLKYGKNKKYIITKFSTVFFLIHVPLFILFGWLALLFIIPSLTAGLIFSYLILNSKNGILYSFTVHQLFYICLALSYRF